MMQGQKNIKKFSVMFTILSKIFTALKLWSVIQPALNFVSSTLTHLRLKTPYLYVPRVQTLQNVTYIRQDIVSLS